MLLTLFTVVPRVRASSDPCAVTAERLATLLEAPETPPAVRDIVKQACASIDLAAAGLPCVEEECECECFVFHGSTGDITAEDIRRELPGRLRIAGHC